MRILMRILIIDINQNINGICNVYNQLDMMSGCLVGG